METALTGKQFAHSVEDLCKFYADYLADHFRWTDLMASKRQAEKTRHGEA